MQTRFRNRNRKVARRIARPSFRRLYTPPGDAKLRNLCSRPFDTARETQRYTWGYHHSGEINYTRNNNRLLFAPRRMVRIAGSFFENREFARWFYDVETKITLTRRAGRAVYSGGPDAFSRRRNTTRKRGKFVENKQSCEYFPVHKHFRVTGPGRAENRVRYNGFSR